MTDNSLPTPSTNRWYSILGFQFSRRQALRAALLLAAGVVASYVAFLAWYIPPRATSRLIRSVGGGVIYRSEPVSNVLPARLFQRQSQMFGFKPTDGEIEFVHLERSSVPDTWLHHLKSLKGLRHLRIHERQLGPGLAELGELPELQFVEIWHLRSGDLGHLQQLPNLRHVSLIQSDCSDVDLSQLALIARLDSLQFPSTVLPVRLFEQLSQIKTLHSLNINSATMDAPGLAGVVHLAKLPALQHLYINDVTDEASAALAQIQSLSHLMIDRANLSDESAASLAKLPKLRELRLTDCVRPLDFETLSQQMPSCRSFRLSYSPRPSPTR